MFKFITIFVLTTLTVLAQDFDFDNPVPRPAPARLRPEYSGSQSNAPKPTPVPIIKQINRHNEDGSYTYGYESADGSFKIETKLPTGEVKGKYGYVDDTGKVRVIEYGATKYGFAPVGEGITVPPPTLVDETTDKQGNLLPEYSYDQDEPEPQRAPVRPQPARPVFEFQNAPRPASRPAPIEYSPPQTFEPAPVPARAAVSGASLAPSASFDFPSRPAPKPAFTPAAPRLPPISNAAPAPLDDFRDFGRPAQKLNFAPDPVSSRPVPQPSFAPVPRPAPVKYRPQPAPISPAGRIGGNGGGSILDQLSKDYALPQGSAAPYHDISFGYF